MGKLSIRVRLDLMQRREKEREECSTRVWLNLMVRGRKAEMRVGR
jgi:hypothetical protein